MVINTDLPKTRLRCFTRALKNARYLRENVPELSESSTQEGFGTGLPVESLARLHRLRADSLELQGYDAISTYLDSNTIPGPERAIRGSVFNGTIYFVQATFRTPQQTFAVATADMNVIVQYAQRSIGRIVKYAGQYGAAGGTISPNVIQFSVTLTGTSYSDADVQGWVNNIASANHLAASSCVFIVSPNGVTGDNVDGNAGYHNKANIPYIVAGIFANNLTLADLPDVYAMVVSHEIAEMIVDPGADQSNPEVCDPCDVNCTNLTRNYFNSNDNYLGSSQALPPGFNYAYYICAIVKPSGAPNCPPPASDCRYAPP